MTKREQLLKELERFKVVPGHGPDLDKMTDEQLELRLKLLESAFDEAFKEE